jgi:iron(III) transport system permease protein
MTIADLFGVTTLADWVYKYHALTPNQVPLWLCVALPWTLVMTFFLLLRSYLARAPLGDYLAFDNNNSSLRTVAHRGLRATLLAASGAIFITMLVAAVPLMALLLKAGWVANVRTGGAGYQFSFGRLATTLRDTSCGFTAEFYWSAYLVVAAVLISVPCGWALSVWSSGSAVLARVFTAAGLLLFVIPGPAVAIMAIEVFNRPGLYWLYDQTLIPTLCALMTRTIPIAYLAFSMTGGQQVSRIREATRIDGVGFWERWWLVERKAWQFPALVAALWVGLYVFADLSTTILILPPGVTTVATRIFGLLHSGVRHQEAGLALFSFFVGVFCTILGLWLLRWYRRSSQH